MAGGGASLGASGWTCNQITPDPPQVNGHLSPYTIGESAVPTSVTGTVAETTLATIPIPAGALGLNGALRVTVFSTNTNNANNKTLSLRLGGTLVQATVRTTTSNQGMSLIGANRGAANSQIWFQPAQGGQLTTLSTAVDTSQNQNLTITATLGNAADSVVLESYLVEVLKP
ncbi:hypothetical protein [Paraburkholderia sp. D1E]|uniref:hypothetical protein n=1 Tax=Paraburkholderia sp. D1E TaxID=3461398 RepID=UPI0040459845